MVGRPSQVALPSFAHFRTTRQSRLSLKRSLLLSLALTLTLAGAKAQTTSPPPGLVVWCSGDGHCFDLAGTNHGTPVGAHAFATGVVGACFSFNDSSEFVPITNRAALNPPASFSLEAWVFPTASAN